MFSCDLSWGFRVLQRGFWENFERRLLVVCVAVGLLKKSNGGSIHRDSEYLVIFQ